MISFFFSVLTCPKQNVLLRTTNQSTDNEESVSLALTYIDMLVSIWLKKKGKKGVDFLLLYRHSLTSNNAIHKYCDFEGH